MAGALRVGPREVERHRVRARGCRRATTASTSGKSSSRSGRSTSGPQVDPQAERRPQPARASGVGARRSMPRASPTLGRRQRGFGGYVRSMSDEEYRTEHDSHGRDPGAARGAVAGPDPARGRELPDQRHPDRAGADPRDRPGEGGRGRRSTASSASSTAEQAAAIEAAARAVAAGDHDDAFPIDVFQTGSGTSSNMNANEVIASLAGRAGVEVHPNDHVNASQSSNDTFPTAIHVAAALAVTDDLLPALDVLATSLEAKAAEFAGLVKSGRTHLMDATPVMLGQEFGGYAATVRYAAERLESVLPRVRELPLGGTAVGTGINTPAGFPEQVIAALSEATGQPFTEARNHFEAQGTRDSLVELSGVLRTYAVGLTKICNDLRWMSSGPTTGPRRDPPARPAAGVEHHARQGQPGAARGHPDGLRAGDRQRRRGHRGRRQRQLRAQRRDAGDRPQPARVGPAARRLLAAARRALRRRHHRRRRPDAASTPSPRPRSSPRSTSTSATRPPPRSPSRRSPTAPRSARPSSGSATSSAAT